MYRGKMWDGWFLIPGAADRAEKHPMVVDFCPPRKPWQTLEQNARATSLPPLSSVMPEALPCLAPPHVADFQRTVFPSCFGTSETFHNLPHSFRSWLPMTPPVEVRFFLSTSLLWWLTAPEYYCFGGQRTGWGWSPCLACLETFFKDRLTWAFQTPAALAAFWGCNLVLANSL